MTTTHGLAIDVLAAALEYARDQSDSPESWMPGEYLALEDDDKNLVDWEMDGILKR